MLYSLRQLCISLSSQLLAQGLIDCHRNASGAGETFALAAFVSGRNRLENEGAIALAEAFRVSQ